MNGLDEFAHCVGYFSAARGQHRGRDVLQIAVAALRYPQSGRRRKGVDFGGALRPGNAHLPLVFEVDRPGVGKGQGDTAFQAHEGGAEILHRKRPGVPGGIGGVAEDIRRRARYGEGAGMSHEVEGRIQGVDAIVHQGTAPGQFPADKRASRNAAVLPAQGFGVVQRSQVAPRNRLARGQQLRHKTPLHLHHQESRAGPGGLYHFPGLGGVGGHGFLHQDVFAGLQGRHHRGAVGPGVGADADRVHRLQVQQLAVVLEGVLCTPVRGRLPGALRVDIRYRDEVRVFGQLPIGFGMGVGNAAAADDANANAHNLPFDQA